VDEVLSVGDAAFQEKSKHRMLELIDKGAAVLFVSHDLQTVRGLSDRVVWLDHGIVRGMGAPDEIISQYRTTFTTQPEDIEP
jgi:ABC-type polysaccharide/polyol phosphate transport system ATPase subunit